MKLLIEVDIRNEDGTEPAESDIASEVGDAIVRNVGRRTAATMQHGDAMFIIAGGRRKALRFHVRRVTIEPLGPICGIETNDWRSY